MATTELDSLQADDVQAAIDQAAPGDTITLPSGVAQWSKGVSINKSLTLWGFGPTETIVERSTDFKGALLSVGPLESDEPVRVSSIGFDNIALWTPEDLVCIYVTGTKNKRSPLSKIRLDHLDFHGGKRQLWIQDWVDGLIDHSSFRNVREQAIFVRGAGYEVYEHPESATLGSLTGWYVEDCGFTNDYKLSDFLGLYDADYGGVCVWRNCTITVATSSGAGIWNCHGNHSLWNPQSENYYTGSRRLEIYDCTISLPTAYRFGYPRGGRILMCDNEFYTADGSNPPILGISEEEGWMTNICDPLRTQWPGEENLHGFFWNNTCNDVPCGTPKPWNYNDSTFLQENRDFFMCAPDETTTTLYPEIPLPSHRDYPYQLNSAKYWPATTDFVKAPYPHPLISESPENPEPEPPGEPTYSKWLDRLAGWIKTNPPTADD